MPRGYIIILNYKKWGDVIECLETVFRSCYHNFSVIVIDNDSQNNSIEHLIDWANNKTELKNRLTSFSKGVIQKPMGYSFFSGKNFPGEKKVAEISRLVFIQNESNKGFAGGMNGVLSHLLMEDAYIWLLNPDMIVEESTLSALVQCAGNNSLRSVTGTVIKYYSDPAKIHLYAGGKINFNSATIELIQNKKDILRLDYVSGGSLFTHASSFKNLGLLPEEYFLYWEETDWCYRAKMNGYDLRICEKAICYDKVSSSIGKSFLADFYYTRNGLLFLSKFKKEKIKIAVFLTLIRFLKRVFTGKIARAKGVLYGLLSFLKKEKHEIE